MSADTSFGAMPAAPPSIAASSTPADSTRALSVVSASFFSSGVNDA